MSVTRAKVAILLSTLALLPIGLFAGQANATSASEPVQSHGVVMLDPCRVADSRNWTTLTTFMAHQSEDLTIAGRCGVPADAAGVITNITAVPTQGPWWSPGGYLTVFPKGSPQPEVSQVSYGSWDTVSAEVTAKLGAGGGVTIFNGAPGSVDVIVDVTAYITA